MSTKETKDPKKDAAKADRIDSIPNLIRDPTSRRYLPTSKIGSGGFASVWRGKIADSRLPPETSECALKVVRTQIKSSQLRQRFRFELGIHNKLRHPHIVGFLRAFAYEELTYVALELCEHGSLTDVVKRRRCLTLPEIRRYTIQLAGAVHYLHARDVVHRDIKAGNVFLDARMDVKLGDFGLATCLEPAAHDLGAFHRRTTFCGTPNYLAPELLSRRGHAKGVDIWALGILVYYLAVGAAPFHSRSKEEIYERVRRQDYAWPTSSTTSTSTLTSTSTSTANTDPDAPEISPELRALVASILVPEESRPAPLHIVRHAFFTTGFIPERIDSLARSRRPRWPPARAVPATYDALVRHAFRVDEAPHEPVLLAVQRELEAGAAVDVPLPQGALVEAFAPRPAPAAAPPKRKRERERQRGPERDRDREGQREPEPERERAPVSVREVVAREKEHTRADRLARVGHEILLDASAGLAAADDAPAAAAPAAPAADDEMRAPAAKRAPFRALMGASGNRIRAAVQAVDAKAARDAETKPLAVRVRTLRSASARLKQRSEGGE